MRRTSLLVLSSLIALPPLASAQGYREGTVLLREGDVLPAFPAAPVTNIDNPATNGIGGFSVGLDVEDGAGVVTNLIWGSIDGFVPPVPLFQQGTYAGFEQGGYEFNHGLADDGMVGYSPSLTEVATGTSGFDSMWVNDVPIAVEDDPIPGLPGNFFRFASRPDVLRDGTPVYVAGLNDSAGTSIGRGLFRGSTVVLKTGDLIPNVAGPLGSSAVDFDFRFSPDGTHFITASVDDSQATSADNVMTIDAEGLLIGGSLVIEDSPVPASAGGLPLENWDNFDYTGITDDGIYAFTGDTDGDSSTDEFIVYNGEIVLREGDALPTGELVTGSVASFGLSDSGRWAAVWSIDDGSGSREALIINGQLAFAVGDSVDFDNDGTVDPLETVQDFNGLNALSFGSDDAVYVVGEVDTQGTIGTSGDDLECLMLVRLPALITDAENVAVAANETATLTVAVPSTEQADFYFLVGGFTGTSPGLPISGVTVPINVDSYTLYTLNTVNGPALNPNFGPTDAFGIAEVQSTPGLIAPPAAIGLTIHHAYVGIAVVGTIPVLSFASNAVDYVLAP